jgi:hypothetical protein
MKYSTPNGIDKSVTDNIVKAPSTGTHVSELRTN